MMESPDVFQQIRLFIVLARVELILPYLSMVPFKHKHQHKFSDWCFPQKTQSLSTTGQKVKTTKQSVIWNTFVPKKTMTFFFNGCEKGRFSFIRTFPLEQPICFKAQRLYDITGEKPGPFKKFTKRRQRQYILQKEVYNSKLCIVLLPNIFSLISANWSRDWSRIH